MMLSLFRFVPVMISKLWPVGGTVPALRVEMIGKSADLWVGGDIPELDLIFTVSNVSSWRTSVRVESIVLEEQCERGVRIEASRAISMLPGETQCLFFSPLQIMEAQARLLEKGVPVVDGCTALKWRNITVALRAWVAMRNRDIYHVFHVKTPLAIH